MWSLLVNWAVFPLHSCPTHTRFCRKSKTTMDDTDRCIIEISLQIREIFRCTQVLPSNIRSSKSIVHVGRRVMSRADVSHWNTEQRPPQSPHLAPPTPVNRPITRAKLRQATSLHQSDAITMEIGFGRIDCAAVVASQAGHRKHDESTNMKGKKEASKSRNNPTISLPSPSLILRKMGQIMREPRPPPSGCSALC